LIAIVLKRRLSRGKVREERLQGGGPVRVLGAGQAPTRAGRPEVGGWSSKGAPSLGGIRRGGFLRPWGYGLARVCRIWGLPRSTLYFQRHRRTIPVEERPGPKKRGPFGACPDEELVGHIGRIPTESPFHGEGYRKTRSVERQMAPAPRLPAVLSGDDRPKGAAEGLDPAALCLDRDRPAALAGTGRSHDAPPPDHPARAQLRGRAPADWRQEQAARARARSADPA
jgi:hypothetical protein